MTTMMTTPAISKSRISEKRSWFTSGPAIVLYLAAGKLLIHMLTASRYGYFRDELYFLDCGEHLDWGYVDQPPMIALVAWFGRHVLGGSLLAIRFLPAFAGAVLVWLTGVITREMGGNRFAQALAALCVLLCPNYLVTDHLMTMNAFEPLFWMGCAYFLLRIINSGNQRYWISFGALAGLGLENKYSMAVFGFGLVVGVLFTQQRRAFAQKWIWIGGALAALIFLPNFFWNLHYHWPFIELMRNIRASGRDVEMSPFDYMYRQFLANNPILFPIWVAGVIYAFVGDKRLRPLGWAYVVTLTAFIVLHGKDYYLAPSYAMLFAAGSIVLENGIRRSAQGWLRPAVVALIFVFTLPLLPIGVPMLPVDAYLRYQRKLPFAIPRSERSHLEAELPQFYADEFGWQEMTAAVARVYNSLPSDERARTAIFGNNFGEAGAIDFFGKNYGLPKAIGGHQNYFLWGPRQYRGDPMIVLGDSVRGLQKWCDKVEVGAELDNPYNPMEHDPVLVCYGFRADLQQVWPKLKKWD